MSRIALIGDNSIEYVSKLVEIWSEGHSIVLIDWRIPLETSIQMMKEAGVNSCIIESQYLKKAGKEYLDAFSFVTYEQTNTKAQLLPNSVYNKYIPNYSSDEAVIIYSSGTTGKAKGIILSHYAVNKNADLIINYMQPKDNDCIYIAKTLSHSSTLVGELLVALKTKTKLVIAPIIVPPRVILKNIINFSVTIMCVNPFLLSLIKDEHRRSSDLGSLRRIYVSGSKLENKLCRGARDELGNVSIYNVYGLSEAGPRVTAQNEDCCTDNSVGKVLNEVHIAIVNERGQIVKNGDRGIIHVKTPCEFAGYVSGREKNKSLYRDWLNTGDIGYEDANGELFIVDRSDDAMIIKSHKVYPGDIEHVIMESTSIVECVVAKMDLGDDEFMACLYVDPSEENNIRAKLQSVLPAYEIPRFFVKCNQIPHTSNGKISRTIARDTMKRILEMEGM